ncbi:MAG: hypothetical protein K2J10_12385, partial [Muribaculaceae bacterium]|nr:hypothetical protein [Muribaculaceae bacterium]
MMKRLINRITNLKPTLLIVAALTLCINVQAQTPETIDSLKSELAKATTPADSVAILHNLYDCFYFNDRKPVLYQIFETAERAGDYRSMLEVLFVLTGLYQYEPEMEQELLKLANRVPESESQKAQILYIKLRYQISSLSTMSEAERQQKLHQALKEYREESSFDKFDRISYLFFICINLRNLTDSRLLTYYLQELQGLVEELPEDELPVRSLYYSLARTAYLNNGLHEQAVKTNERILQLVNQFDKFHESQGRIFRNYDGSLYQCYHDMLVCADVLSDEDIDMSYNKILNLISTNPRIHQDKGLQNRSRIFYLMAKKRYDEALPLIKEQLKSGPALQGYILFVKALVKAASETGDKEALLYGSEIINSMYKERLNARSDVSLSELQTIYDVESLKGQNKDLIIENQRIDIDSRQQTIVAMVIAVLVLICVLVWMISMFLHSRWLAKRLFASNKKLIEERNALKETYAKLIEVRDKAKAAERIKNDFVENMSEEIRVPLGAIVEYSHLVTDFAEEDERAYIREYADAMSVNTDLLIRLVNDVLDLPQLESGELSIHRSPSSVKGICNFAIDLVKKHVSPNVKIIFANAGQPDSI